MKTHCYFIILLIGYLSQSTDCLSQSYIEQTEEMNQLLQQGKCYLKYDPIALFHFKKAKRPITKMAVDENTFYFYAENRFYSIARDSIVLIEKKFKSIRIDVGCDPSDEMCRKIPGKKIRTSDSRLNIDLVPDLPEFRLFFKRPGQRRKFFNLMNELTDNNNDRTS